MGTGSCIAEHYMQPLQDIRNIFDMAAKMGMPPMNFVGIGGGWTYVKKGKHPENFDNVAPKLGKLIDKYFGDQNIRIVADAGRFLTESVTYVAIQITGQKTIK